MSYELIISSEAEREIDSAFNWYEDQDAGLGKEFLRSIDAILLAVSCNPLSYQFIHKKLRRILLRRFPHALFYIVEEQQIKIVACIHQRRHPISWKRRT